MGVRQRHLSDGTDGDPFNSMERALNMNQLYKPKRHNGRIGWKARAIQAQQDLNEYRDEIRMKMWVCFGIGVACGSVGVTGAFFILTIVN